MMNMEANTNKIAIVLHIIVIFTLIQLTANLDELLYDVKEWSENRLSDTESRHQVVRSLLK